MDNSQLTELFTEAGPLIDAEELSYDEDEQVWGFTFDGEPPCLLQVGANPQHIVLSGEIAPLPEGGRLKLYELMLRYNDQAAESGGVRLAIDDPEGAAILSVDLNRDGLTLESISQLVEGFLGLRRSWMTILGEWQEEDASTTPSGFPQGSIIQV